MPAPHARFTPRQLHAFLAVVDALNFAKAGERLSLTASAVSQLIAELESAVGFRLFDRTTRSVAVSPAGREFIAPARSVLRQIELARLAAHDIRDRAAGTVRIAAPMVIASTILPAVIRAYRHRYPRVVVRIRDAAVDDLVMLVAQAEVDLAIGPDQGVGADVVRTRLFESPWVLWCAADHPLAAAGPVTWAALRPYPVVAAGQDYERNMRHMRAGSDPDERPVPIESVDHISTALGMASEGLALTMGPAYIGRLARSLGLTMQPIVEPAVLRQVCLYHSAMRAVSPAAQGFREHMSAVLTGQDDLGTLPLPDV